MEADSDLLLRQAAKVGEFECTPLVVGESGEGTADTGLFFSEADEPDGVDAIASGDCGECLIGTIAGNPLALLAAAASAKFIDGTVAGDAHEPAEEAATFGDEAFGAAPEADEDVLGGILSQLSISEDAKRGGIDEIDVAIVDDGESEFIAGGNGNHKDFIRPFGP